MSEYNSMQLRLAGSLFGYENGHPNQHTPSTPEASAHERTLETEAALGQLLMEQVEAPDAIQEPIPDLFEELDQTQAESEIPHNIIRGEE